MENKKVAQKLGHQKWNENVQSTSSTIIVQHIVFQKYNSNG